MADLNVTDILSKAEEIRTESIEQANSAARVGQVLKDITNYFFDRITGGELGVYLDYLYSPKGTYADMAALEAAKPTGAEGIYLTVDDGNWNFWNGEEWEAGGLYQAALDVVGELGTSETKVINQKTHLDNISFPFYNAGFGHTDTANQLKVLSAIKSLRLIGNWDLTNNYAIRSIYRNHTTAKWQLTIYELTSAGAIVSGIVYNSGNFDVTEAGAGKHTKVSYPVDINGRSVELVIDYNQLTENSELYNFYNSPYNWLIKKSNYDKKAIYEDSLSRLKRSVVFYDSGFGFSDTVDQILVHNAIQDIRLIGSGWDRNLKYQIRSIYRNHSTYKYQLIIQSVNDLGVVTGVIYSSGAIDVTEAGVGKYTRVPFPVVSNKSVELVIDYNVLTTSGYSFYLGSLNWLIRPEKIDKTATYEADLLTLQRSQVFYNAGFGYTDTTNVLLVNNAIKGIALFGDWNKSTRYAIRFISRNHSTSKYSIIICSVSNTGVESVIYISGAIDVTENTGKQTIVSFPMVSGRQVVAVIDYAVLTDATEYNLFGVSKNWMIRSENINPSSYNKYLLDINGVFYNAGFGHTDTDSQILILSAIKNIRLIGNWNTSKNYAIKDIYRDNSINKYAIIIAEISDTGNLVSFGSDGYSSGVFDSGSSNEAGAGKYTRVLFPTVNGKAVELVIDYNIFASSAYNFTTYNYIIKPEKIDYSEFIFDKSVRGEILDFDYIPYITGGTSIKNVLLQKIKPSTKCNITNKKGAIAIRIDDNQVDAVTAGSPSVFDAIFDKFGYKVIYSVNCALPEIERFSDVQRRGHELCDHTPNHNCNYFTLPPNSIDLFTSLIGHGIKSIANNKATLDILILDNAVDVSNPANVPVDLVNLKIGTNNAYSLVSGTARINGDFSAYLASPYFFVYIDNINGDKIGWVPVKWNDVHSDYCLVKMPDESEIVFTADENITLYAQRTGHPERITLSNDATYCLMLAGVEWFRYYGLETPFKWSQPGGTWPYLNPASATFALKKLGMEYASLSTAMNDVARIITYNHERTYPKINQFTADLDFGSSEYADLDVFKARIAEYIAKRCVVTMLSHHYIAKTSFGGSTAAEKLYNYQKFTHDLLEWCFEQNIPVISQAEIIELTNNSTTNRFENIMPDLYTDRAAQGKPDGYSLGDGVLWINNDGMHEDKIHALKLNGNGQIFTLSDLGGLEKGNNDFEIWIKGTAGAIVSVEFGALGAAIFMLTTTGAWQKFRLSDSSGITALDIPYTTNFLTITATASNNSGTAISVSGMKLYGI